MLKRLFTKKNQLSGLFNIHLSSATEDSTGGDPKFSGAEAPREHSCGIPPWKVFHVDPPPPPPPEFPSHLIRPPCIPGSKHGGYQTCVKGTDAYFCVPCREKYKYPPFSENIDFVPPYLQDPPCWWKLAQTCHSSLDSKVLEGITKRWPCNYDDGGVE